MKTILFGLCLLASLALAGAGDAQSRGKGKVLRYSDIKLNGPMPRLYREFKRYVDTYGAMYVTDTGGGGGRIGAQPSLEAAKREALGFCTRNNPHKKCILYAVKIPKEP